jgi:AcrR family transcriptional regulator
MPASTAAGSRTRGLDGAADSTIVPAKRSTKEALLDACEEVIIESGAASVTTRRVAGVAGVNQALVHYHFGSVDQLLVAVLHRVTERTIEQTRVAFEREGTFIEKWRASIEGGLEDAMRKGWPKLWLEIIVLAQNKPEMRRLASAHTRDLNRIYEQAMVEEIRKDGAPVDEKSAHALLALLRAISLGMVVDSLTANLRKDRKVPGVISDAFEHDALALYLRLVNATDVP